MTIEIKHPFVSLKGDGGDATLVKPSHWNAAHTTSMDTGKLLGRLTIGVGEFEEISISPLVAAALSATSGEDFLAALNIGGFSTGDIKPSFNSVADAGWVLVNNGTIGNAASGATTRANADVQSLYVMIYDGISDTYCPVTGGRTGNALNDFNAGKKIQLPWAPGRALVGVGGGGSLTTRVLGQYGGAETHVLTVAELATHYHPAAIYDPTHTHTSNAAARLGGSSTGGGAFATDAPASATINAAATNIRANSTNGLDTTYSTGSSSAHNNMMPFLPVYMWVKL